jgi:hypothetical protein
MQATRNLNGITAAQQRAFQVNLANAQATQAAMAQQYNSFSQMQTGTGTFIDASGNSYTLSTAPAYHWVGAGGKTADTPTATPPPGTGWTPLKPAPAK